MFLSSFLFLVGRLEVEMKLDSDSSIEIPQTPAAQRSSKPKTRPKRRARKDEDLSEDSDEETPAAAIGQTISGTIGTRSQRASKTAALSKMTTSKVVRIEECDDEEERKKGQRFYRRILMIQTLNVHLTDSSEIQLVSQHCNNLLYASSFVFV